MKTDTRWKHMYLLQFVLAVFHACSSSFTERMQFMFDGKYLHKKDPR